MVGMMLVSEDSGKSWTPPVRLPTEIFGPIKNKPVLLKGQRLLCPSSTEGDGWKIHMEYTDDWGRIWHATSSLNDGKEYDAIQPALLFHPHDALK